MTRTMRSSAIVANTIDNRATGKLLMPDGQTVFVLNRRTHEAGLRAAGQELTKILEAIRSDGKIVGWKIKRKPTA